MVEGAEVSVKQRSSTESEPLVNDTPPDAAVLEVLVLVRYKEELRKKGARDLEWTGMIECIIEGANWRHM